jgi:prepilin-type N-terminal cleavage/methylation domain-containing protein
MRFSRSQKGFSLIELAIALTVIGILTAGALTGQRMIETANLRSVITDLQEYQGAFKIFKTQYGAYPGDISNAHSYWDNGANTVCGTAAQCNGDKNGKIELGSADNDREVQRAWQHLSLAQFIEGRYNGLGPRCAAGSQPTGPIDGSTYLFGVATTAVFGKYGNSIEFAGIGSCEGPILMPSEAKEIDKKIDDGVANTGLLFAVDGVGQSAAACSQAIGHATGANYSTLSDTAKRCRLYLWLE